ncbi:HbrB-like protein [Tothia fuscella]|uniref:HbrB-like protein n=1 Tax=Tothia fuscella TaxID=1048955 RepID=A0A9P4NUW7_9PEZI|nr:HbrB-like protein [Tothia fuscella]
MNTSPAKPSLNSPIVRASDGIQTLNRSRTISISSSEDSDSSRTTTLTHSSPFIPKRSLYGQANASSSSVHSFSRPLPRTSDSSSTIRRAESPPVDHFPLPTPTPHQAPHSASGAWIKGHRPRQHSQGFFDPTLSSATPNEGNMTGLTASQAAAQAAMNSQNSHMRKRSQTLPDPSATPPPNARRPPPPTPTMHMPSNPNLRNYDGFLGGHSLAAVTAANTAFPRSPQYSPQLPPERAPPPVPEKDVKPSKEKSKMKLFSKPKSISIYKEKDPDRKHPPLPSPGKMPYASATLSRLTNASTTSLIDPSSSSAASFYSSANASTSTLVPADKEKEKHKHHFLSRPKKKDKDEFHLPLSSASSTSRPTDPSAPQPLYSFQAAPASPGHSSSFAKSVSGFDLRHGGRALREKKKDDKASLAPSNLSSTNNLLDTPYREREQSFSHGSDWQSASSYTGTTPFGPSASTANMSLTSDVSISQPGVASLGAAFGVPGITPDDAWPLLKARLLHIFEGEDPRPPIEDFNALVSVHLKRCIQRRAPTVMIEDLNELLQTGFLSLEQTLRPIPDERLVTALVSMWMLVFSTILPFMQAVFLPLDLEFKGRGSIMTPREAADFWGAALPSDSDVEGPNANKNIPVLGEELDVRRITLLRFRDSVILPRNDTLMAIFSRLSLDSISGGFGGVNEVLEPPSLAQVLRPGTGHSNEASGSGFNSFASSSHLDSASPFSAAARSRATSNTSAGSFHSSVGGHSLGHYQQPPPMDSAQVTEMVGRMLQCVSVLASVQSGDEAQGKMERLTKELKLNWLGRGRTGRQRRGFVGTRTRRGEGGVLVGVA